MILDSYSFLDYLPIGALDGATEVGPSFISGLRYLTSTGLNAEGGESTRRKNPSAQTHRQARSGSGPAREAGFRRRDLHAHHVCQRNPEHVQRQGR